MEDDTYVQPVALRKTGIRHFICARPDHGLHLCRSLARQFLAISALVRKETSLVPSLQRIRDSLAVAYVKLVDRADLTAANSSSCGYLRKDIVKIREKPLYLTGKACLARSSQIQDAFFTALHKHEARLLELEPGDVIQYARDLGPAFSLVQEGTLEVWAEHHHVSNLVAGHTIGEVAVLLKELPVPTIMLKAASPVKLAYLPSIEFADMGKHHTNLLVATANILAERLESVHRFVHDPGDATRIDLDMLTGHDTSCAEIFSDFARLLPVDDPAMAELNEMALTLSTQARHDRHTLFETCRDILAICGDDLREEDEETEDA
jgi:CRP-like cAMP-binding protein